MFVTICTAEELPVKSDMERISKLQKMVEELGKKRAETSSDDLQVVIKNKQREFDEALKEIHRLKEVVAKQQSDYALIISANEQIIEDLQKHFYTFSESAGKELESVRGEMERLRTEKERELAGLREESLKLNAELEKVKSRAKESATDISRLQGELASKLKESEEQTKAFAESKQQAVDDKKKYEGDLQEKQGELNKIYELNEIIQSLRLQLELKEQEAKSVTAQLKTQSDIFDQLRTDLQSQVKELQDREAILTKRVEQLSVPVQIQPLLATPGVVVGATLSTEKQTELIQSLEGENGSLKFNLDRLRGDHLAARADCARLAAENEKLKGECAILTQALSVLDVKSNRVVEEVR